MKSETETLLRNIISLDSEITKENAEKAIDIMRGKVVTDDDLVHVLRYKEVMDLLHVHRRTLEYYIDRGYLDRVYGRGERALGISRESFLRFTTQRRVVRNHPERRRGAGEPVKAETTLRRASAFEPNNKERKHKR